MSNAQVGNIYQQIIADAIESSRVDFEEGGVDEHVLEELRQGWQQKLSQLQIATFPWDPKPEPVVPAAPPPQSIANYQPMNPAPISQNQGGMTLPSLAQNSGPRVKPEPGLETTPIPLASQPFPNTMLNMANATTAQQRAAAHLANNYGQRAAASISAIQGGISQQQGQANTGPMQQPQAALHQPQILQQQMQARQPGYPQQQQAGRGQGQPQPAGQGQGVQGPRPNMSQEEYNAEMKRHIARQAAQVQAQAQSQNGLKAAQTDGAGDELGATFGVVRGVDARGREVEMGRVEIDGLIRRRIEALGQSMEGGGLMLPLEQLSKAGRGTERKRDHPTGVAAAQVDGPGSGDDSETARDEADEDAINSDLDDPDDGLNEDEDDEESLGHIMLCVYDKVQRVKNKWKCVMKDGVLTVNGREYVFHKATGEYEW